MELIQALVLGLIQGATEFVPVSSSAHLVLVPWLLGWPHLGLTFDTTLHLGTLVAVVAYFWRDFVELAGAWVQSVARRSLANPKARVAWWIIVGTVPAAIMGVLWEKQFEALFGSPGWVAGLLLVTGLILAVSERWGRRTREMEHLTLLDSILIGVAQGFAIAPGLSRSGATIAAGLGLGLKREQAARYSFLLATPIIFGAGLLQLKDVVAMAHPFAYLPPLIAGFGAAAVSGYLCIRFLLLYLQRRRLYVFAVYCWLLGAGSLLIVLLRG